MTSRLNFACTFEDLRTLQARDEENLEASAARFLPQDSDSEPDESPSPIMGQFLAELGGS